MQTSHVNKPLKFCRWNYDSPTSVWPGIHSAVLFSHSSFEINSIYLEHISAGNIHYYLYVFNLLRINSTSQLPLTTKKAVMTYRRRYCNTFSWKWLLTRNNPLLKSRKWVWGIFRSEKKQLHCFSVSGEEWGGEEKKKYF